MAAKQLALALALVATASAAPADDAVLSLPGWSGDLPSSQFSGYLDLPSTSKHLHYWMVESEGNPEGTTSGVAPSTIKPRPPRHH